MIKLQSIDMAEAERYLGYRGAEADGAVKSLMAICEKEILGQIRPIYTCKCYEIESHSDPVTLKGSRLTLPGNDISKHLSGCRGVILMCATLGASADAIIRKAEAENPAKALVADSLLNSAIEQVCNAAEAEIKPLIPAEYFTSRFSPGYGDLPLEIQSIFLSAVDALRRVGVSVNSSNLLTPLKTVTAIIGFSDSPIINDAEKCDRCSKRETCNFRKAGNRCGI